MECVTPFINAMISGPLVGFVMKHWDFVFSSTNNVTALHARIEQLNTRALDVKTRKERCDAKDLVVPHNVPAWLEQVEKISEEVKNIPTGGIGYKAGKKSSDILRKIDDLEKQDSATKWSDELSLLGRVQSTGASTSKSVATATDEYDDGTQTGLKSRDLIFKEAMKSLDPNNKIQKIALCGMGGVGKTTMMEQLTKVAEYKEMFYCIVKVVIGKSENLNTIQETVAEYTGGPLTEAHKDTKADRLRKRFVRMSEDGKKKILVILDDLWEVVDLKDIGLTNPLPKGFKLLLTSREETVCTRMDVKASSIFKIAVLEKPEAKKLFWEIAGRFSDGDIDHDICKIGEDIINRCGGLPIAIKTIASTLKDNNIKDAWKDALFRLQNEKLPILDEIFKISYDNLKDDDEKATFLLSGLFPEDYNIPIEDLMRYGWGLKFFQNVNCTTARLKFFQNVNCTTARRRVNTCVNNLVRSNMLIESDRKGCVKMHDLVRDFVLKNFAHVKQASLVNSDDIAEQLTEESYERILLKCRGMREFPADFNHPNLALLKLLDGDKLRTFPKDFYDRMEKLEVVAYDRICQPLLPRYSTTLRTLCLHSCRSVGDISFIGDLINLEVLSFAFCGILKLPSAIGNLERLKLLDLTECVDLCIDDGVFQKLEKLRELYMKAYKGKPIRFTEDSCKGLEMRSSTLIALDVEFFKSIIQPKSLSFEKLERFRISMGCELEFYVNDVDAYENTLKLNASCKEVLECKIHKLFEKTDILNLSVDEISSLEQISMYPSQRTFCNLRVLSVFKCAHLTSIFTVNVASSLTKLESLRVSRCPVLKFLVQEGEISEAKVIKFHKLKLLELNDLPMFVSFCDTNQVMELPQLVELILNGLPNVTSIFFENKEVSATMQSLLNKKIVIQNLEKLTIIGMKKLKEIWSCENTSILEEDVNIISMLREIAVYDCPSLVNVFPCNPMRLLNNLAVINGQKQQPLSLFHNLTRIYLTGCGSIKYLFSPLMATHLSNLKNISISNCDGMEEVVSNRDDDEDEQMIAPTTTTLFPHLDQLSLISLPSLKHVGGGVAKGTNNDISDQVKYSPVPVVCWSLCQYSRNITVWICPAMSHVIPSYVAGQFLKVESLTIDDCIVMKEVFATTYINNSGGLSSNFKKRSGDNNTPLAIPRLTSITAHKLSNLKTMVIRNCNSLEHIFTFSTLQSLTKLEEISIISCKAMKVIVREENGEKTVASKAVVFPRPKSIISSCHVLESLVQGENSEAKVIKCRKLKILKLYDLPMFVSLCDTDQVMELPQRVMLDLYNLPNVTSIFSENNEISATRQPLLNKKIVIPNFWKLSIKRMDKLKEIWSCENTSSISEKDVNNISMLREIQVEECYSLVNFFPCNPMRLLSHLVVINDQKQQPLSLFHNLTTINLTACWTIKYLFSPLMATHLSKLKKITIWQCGDMEEVVSNRDDNEDEQITAPTTTTLFPHLDELNLGILESLKHFGGGIAKGTNNDINDQLKYNQVSGVCWSLCQYSRKINVWFCPAMSHVIPSYVAGQFLMVESLCIDYCEAVKEVFATTDINNSGVLSSNFKERSDGTDTALAIPRLTSITAHKLSNLKTMFIRNCNSLEHIFTFSTLESLTKLEEISISRCKAMKVIVREENGEQTVASKAVIFPRLKSIKLTYLPILEGFFLGITEFKWPLLDDVTIIRCPKLMAFTSSKSTAPKLKSICSTFSTYCPEWCNFYVTANLPQTPSLSLQNGPLSLHDTIEVNLEDNDLLEEEIFASNESLQLQNLEQIHVKRCKSVVRVFEVESEVTNSELNSTSQTQTVFKFPKLREVELEDLNRLEYIWKSKIQGMKLEFPNLTRLSIHNCYFLRYALTSSMLGSLMQLQDLQITNCYNMEVIVKEEEDEENKEEECDGDGKLSEIIVLPCLMSLTLEDLLNLKGFYLGKEVDFSLPSLNRLVIKGCPELEIFTKGLVATPELKVIETNLGLIDVGEQDINSFIITKSQEGLHFERY